MGCIKGSPTHYDNLEGKFQLSEKAVESKVTINISVFSLLNTTSERLCEATQSISLQVIGYTAVLTIKLSIHSLLTKPQLLVGGWMPNNLSTENGRPVWNQRS